MKCKLLAFFFILMMFSNHSFTLVEPNQTDEYYDDLSGKYVYEKTRSGRFISRTNLDVFESNNLYSWRHSDGRDIEFQPMFEKEFKIRTTSLTKKNITLELDNPILLEGEYLERFEFTIEYMFILDGIENTVTDDTFVLDVRAGLYRNVIQSRMIQNDLVSSNKIAKYERRVYNILSSVDMLQVKDGKITVELRINAQKGTSFVLRNFFLYSKIISDFSSEIRNKNLENTTGSSVYLLKYLPIIVLVSGMTAGGILSYIFVIKRNKTNIRSIFSRKKIVV